MKHFLWLLLLPPMVSSLPFRLNLTGSVPVGLYRQTTDSRARFAGFCLAESQLETARAAGVQMATGTCGVQPVLKPIFRASKANPIVLSEDGFHVHGRLLPNTAPKSKSLSGKPLVHFRFGIYTEGLWAVSFFNKDSFDSRYFGSIQSSQIQFYAAPFLTF